MTLPKAWGLAFPVILLAFMGCSSADLEQTLAATDQGKFNEALKIHGPVSDWEVSALVQATQGKDANRARNAPQLLAAARSPQAAEALQQLGDTTPDIDLWATATSSLLMREELGHGKLPASLARADIAKAGLQSSDPKIYQTSFKIARRLKLPELQGKRDEESRESEELVTIVSMGSNPSKMRPDLEKLIHGQAAVHFAEKWLKEHEGR